MGDEDVSLEFTMLDGCSMILGAAIASIHLRLTRPDPHTLPTWCWVIGLFGWLAMTASGPFLYLSRRFLDRADRGSPQIGDRLWALWGIPWVATAVVEAFLPSKDLTAGRLDPVYVGSLGLGLFLATMIGTPVLAARVLWGDPESHRRVGRVPWSQWVGMGLTATWPIQCGVGLVLIG